MKLIGIDEAGRGCVIGPMAVAIVSIVPAKSDTLKNLGIKDSKLIAPKKRYDFVKIIKGIAFNNEVRLIDPRIIDNYREKNHLNLLEAEVCASLIQRVSSEKDTIYIDAPGKHGTKFSKQIHNILKNKYNIIAENKADLNYPVVAAASILAKVSRDNAIEQLKKKFGDFGSGYPSDKKTVNFLANFYKKNKTFPDCVRKSWATLNKIVYGEQKEFLF